MGSRFKKDVKTVFGHFVFFLSGKNASTYKMMRSHPQLDIELTYGESYMVMGTKDNADLTKVVIPEGVESIFKEAFQYAKKIKEIAFPKSLAYIGEEAFRYCISLEEVILSDNVFTIKDKAFENCVALVRVRLPAGLTGIANECFMFCRQLREVVIPGEVTEIGDGAFALCVALTSVTLPDSITSIGSEAFSWCKSLVSVKLPPNIGAIRSKTFDNCDSLKKVEIPENVKEIGEFAFYNCRKLKEVVMPKGIKMADSSFGAIPDLERLVIGDHVINIPANFPEKEAQIGAYVRKAMIAVSGYCTPEAMFGDGSCGGELLCEMIYQLMKQGLPQAGDLIEKEQETSLRAAVMFNYPEMFGSLSEKYPQAVTPEFMEEMLNTAAENGYNELYIVLVAFRDKYLGFDNDDEDGGVADNRFDL